MSGSEYAPPPGWPRAVIQGRPIFHLVKGCDEHKQLRAWCGEMLFDRQITTDTKWKRLCHTCKRMTANNRITNNRITNAGGEGRELCERTSPPPCSASDVSAKYNELLYAVARKFPGESRHKTALRYIRQAEEVHAGPCMQNINLSRAEPAAGEA